MTENPNLTHQLAQLHEAYVVAVNEVCLIDLVRLQLMCCARIQVEDCLSRVRSAVGIDASVLDDVVAQRRTA